MTDYAKLIERAEPFMQGLGKAILREIAASFEALQGEVEQVKGFWKEAQLRNQNLLEEGNDLAMLADQYKAERDKLQGENERLTDLNVNLKNLADGRYEERVKVQALLDAAIQIQESTSRRADALQAKLDELQRQEPVAYANDDWSQITFPLSKVPTIGGPIYAAPKAPEEPEPREQRADWLPITNALDHAVRELGRTKEASAHDWNTAVHVFEFARGTTCTCCSSPTQWPDAYRCLDCKAVLCEACAPAHFGPDHSKRAAEAHKKDMNSTIESPAHTLTEYFKEVQDRVVSTSTLTHEDIDIIVDPYTLWDVYEDAVGEDLRQFSKNNKEQSREVAALFFELGRQAGSKALEPRACEIFSMGEWCLWPLDMYEEAKTRGWQVRKLVVEAATE